MGASSQPRLACDRCSYRPTVLELLAGGEGNPTAPVTPTSSIQDYHFVAAGSTTGEFCCMRGVWKIAIEARLSKAEA